MKVHLKFSEEPVSLPVSGTDGGNRQEESFSPAMQNLQQLADQATRTARKNYMWMALYAVLMFFLALFAGVTYKHYKVTGELLPLQWLGIESPKEALKSLENQETQKNQEEAPQE